MIKESKKLSFKNKSSKKMISKKLMIWLWMHMILKRNEWSKDFWEQRRRINSCM